jgi:hypothetical protein
MQVAQLDLQVLPVLLLRDAIHSHGCILADAVVARRSASSSMRFASDMNRLCGSRFALSLTSRSRGDMLSAIAVAFMVPS